MTDVTDVTKQIPVLLEQEKENILTFWEKIVNIESGSSDKEGLDRLRDFLVQAMTDLGAKVRCVPYEKAGDLIVATFNGEAQAEPIVFSGHYDTVFKRGTIQERPFTMKDGKVFGPGVLDMKAGVTMAIHIAKILLAAGYKERPIKIVLAGDEEVGHHFSTAADDFMEAVTGAKAAFNFETGYLDNGIVIGRKGGANAIITCHGIGAHAGNEPEKGRSAILELAHKAIDIQSRTDFDAGITYNVGVFQGGTVPNAVPEQAKMVVDIRYRKLDQLEIIKKDLAEVLAVTHVDGTTTEMNMHVSIEPMETTEGVKALFSLLQATARELGLGEYTEKYVGGGADSAYEVKAGVPTVCAVGVAGGKNHSVDEFAVVDTMFERANLIAHTVLKVK